MVRRRWLSDLFKSFASDEWNLTATLEPVRGCHPRNTLLYSKFNCSFLCVSPLVSLCLSGNLSLDRLLLLMCNQSDRAVGRTLNETTEKPLTFHCRVELFPSLDISCRVMPLLILYCINYVKVRNGRLQLKCYKETSCGLLRQLLFPFGVH